MLRCQQKRAGSEIGAPLLPLKVSSFFILPSAFLARHPAKSNLARGTEWVQIGGRENKR
jgi:hypothetical protein